MFVLSVSVWSCVRKLSLRGRCLMLMLSGPVELLFLLFLIVSWTCALVSCMYVVLSLLMFLSTTLFCLLCV